MILLLLLKIWWKPAFALPEINLNRCNVKLLSLKSDLDLYKNFLHNFIYLFSDTKFGSSGISSIRAGFESRRHWRNQWEKIRKFWKSGDHFWQGERNSSGVNYYDLLFNLRYHWIADVYILGYIHLWCL